MSVPASSSSPASTVGFRRVPYIPCGVVAALVLLRLCVGWHFFQEGSKKITYNPATGESRVSFNAEPILKMAVGPLAPTVKASLPNFHEWERLLVVPREAGAVDAAKEAAWRSEDGKRRQAAIDGKEQPAVEFYPELPYAAWATRVAADWQRDVDEFKALDGLTDEQRAAAQQAVDARVKQLDGYLAGERTAIADWQHELWRLKEWEAAPGAADVPFEAARIVEKRAETGAASAGWIAEVRGLEQGLDRDLRGLLTDEQEAGGTLVDQVDGVLADPQEKDLHRVNVGVTWLVTGIGVCLLLGLFTRLASLAGIVFLLSIIATQPPWVEGAITTVFYYQLVEIAAFVVLFASGAGRWGGLDHFLYSMARGCCRRKETILS